jgi:cardiolipin synthase
MPEIPARQYDVIRGEAFILDVAHEAKKAKHLLWAQTMDYSPGEVTDSLTKIFTDTAKRGVDVKFNIDYYSLMFDDGDINYVPIFNKQKSQEHKRRLVTKIQSIHNLRDANVDVHFINKPDFLGRVIPMKGRNHMKIVIIDNAAWIGGINFHDMNLTCDDFMVKLTDIHIIKFLKQLFFHMHDDQEIFDMAASFSKETKLFIDGGHLGKSIILNEANKILQSATRYIKYSSAFYPDGTALSILDNAYKQGIDVKVVVPEVKNVDGIAAIADHIDIAFMKLTRKKIPYLVNKRKMHSKLIIVDDTIALFGSHNFSKKGVRLGTAEIAMETTNPTLITNLNNYYDYLLTGTD